MAVLYKYKFTTIFEHWPNEKVVVAETEERARFLYWQQFRTRFITIPMTEFMKFVRCENEGVLDIRQMFSAEKAFKKMQKFRKLDFAYMGMRVNVTGKWGTIIGNWKTNLFILFDGEVEPYNCHPHWEIAYYDDEGNVVRDYQKGEYAI